MYHVLTTNIEEIKEQGLESKSHEISVAVKVEDILNGVNEPKLYAFRYGMIYDSENEFKPNVSGQKIKGAHVESYYQQLPTARKKYKELLEGLKKPNSENGSSSAEIAELKKKLEQKQIRIDEQTKKIDELTKNGGNKNEMKQLAEMIKTLKEVQSNRIEIKIGDKPTKVIEDIVHDQFEKIVRIITMGHAAYMYGAAGTGKSKIAEQVADALGYGQEKFYPASTVTQEFKLTGFVDGNGVYHETNFYKAMKNGGIFFLDEMDSCSPDVLVAINGALASGYFDFPNGTVYAHKDFRVIAAGNTIGRGGNAEYTGRFALDISTLDRFLAVKIDYSEKIDYAVSGENMELVKFAQSLRQASETTEIQILMSYRSISRIVDFQEIFDLVEVMDMALIKGMAVDDVSMLARNMSIDSTNKYYKAFKAAAAA